MSSPFRIGLFGCGARTRQLIQKAVQNGIAKISLCYDINHERAQNMAEEFGGKACTKEELLSGKGADMLLISLFPAAHPDALLEAMESGLPIYIEKPVAVFMEDVKRLIPLIGKGYVHVGLFYEYIDVFRTLSAEYRKEKIGNLININFNWLSNPAMPDQLQKEKLNWRHRPETGGELTQHYCHCFDWFRQLGGNFTSIAAMSNTSSDNHGCVEDTWDLIMKLENGCQVSFHSSNRNPRFTVLGDLEGDKGTLSWEWTDPSSISFLDAVNHKRTPGVPVPVDSDIPDAVETFITRYSAGKEPVVSLEDGLWSVLPPIYARESVETGKIVFFPKNLKDLLNY